jgi:hypothetical protein
MKAWIGARRNCLRGNDGRFARDLPDYLSSRLESGLVRRWWNKEQPHITSLRGRTSALSKRTVQLRVDRLLRELAGVKSSSEVRYPDRKCRRGFYLLHQSGEVR